MRYLLILFEQMRFWIETDEDNYAYRQIVLNAQGEYAISCREDCLAEGSIDEASLEGSIFAISRNEFDEIWNKAKSAYLAQWELCKQCHPIGSAVDGVFRYSYPQGSVVTGEGFFALYIGESNFILNNPLKAKVVQHDEINMWLIIE